MTIAWIWFFARVRPRTSCERREIRRRSTLVCSSQHHVPGSIPAASSLASVRASLGIGGGGLLAASLVLTVRCEETELALVHGQAYRDYCARVRRFLPAVGRLAR